MAKEKESITEATSTEATADAVKAEEPETKMVEVNLFKDNKDYRDDVFVCINGKNMVVKRGESVMIPEAYAKVINQSLKQDTKTAALMDEMQDRFREEAKKN